MMSQAEVYGLADVLWGRCRDRTPTGRTSARARNAIEIAHELANHLEANPHLMLSRFDRVRFLLAAGAPLRSSPTATQL